MSLKRNVRFASLVSVVSICVTAGCGQPVESERSTKEGVNAGQKANDVRFPEIFETDPSIEDIEKAFKAEFRVGVDSAVVSRQLAKAKKRFI